MISVAHIKEMQMETTQSCHFPPIRLAQVQTFGSTFCWGGSGQTSAPLCSWWECKRVQPLCRKFWQKPAKRWVYSTCDSGTPLLGVYSSRYTKRCEQKDFYCTSTCNSKRWKTRKCPSAGELAGSTVEDSSCEGDKEILIDRLQATGGTTRWREPWIKQGGDSAIAGQHTHLRKEGRDTNTYVHMYVLYMCVYLYKSRRG